MVSVSVVTHFICAVVVSCFCIIMTMDNWASRFDLQRIRMIIRYYIYEVFFIVGTLSVVYSTWRNSRNRTVAEVQQDQRTFLLTFTGMAIFFIAILINDSLYMFHMTYCLQALVELDCDLFQMTGFILYHSGEPVYFGAQLMFMIWIRYNRFNRQFNLTTKIAHSVCIAINLALIIYSANYELRITTSKSQNENGTYNYFVCNQTKLETVEPVEQHMYATCMVGNTTLLKLSRTIFPYIFPMQVQFAFLAISVLIGQMTVSIAESPIKNEGVDDNHDDYTSLSHTQRHVSPPRDSLGRRARVFLSPFLPRSLRLDGSDEQASLLTQQRERSPPSMFDPLLVIGLFLCCFQIIGGVVGERDLANTLWFVLLVNFSWHLSLIAASGHILMYMRKNNQAIMCTPLPSSAIVILISSACAYILYYYKLIACSDLLVRPFSDWQKLKHRTRLNDYRLGWYVACEGLNSCIRILSIVLQSLIIVRVCRELSTSGYCLRLTRRVRTALYYLLLTNIVSWFWDSIVSITQNTVVNEIYYCEESGQSLTHVFMPGFMYFEFHCGMILAEYMIAQWYHNVDNGSDDASDVTTQNPPSAEHNIMPDILSSPLAINDHSVDRRIINTAINTM